MPEEACATRTDHDLRAVHDEVARNFQPQSLIGSCDDGIDSSEFHEGEPTVT